MNLPVVILKKENGGKPTLNLNGKNNGIPSLVMLSATIWETNPAMILKTTEAEKTKFSLKNTGIILTSI